MPDCSASTKRSPILTQRSCSRLHAERIGSLMIWLNCLRGLSACALLYCYMTQSSVHVYKSESSYNVLYPFPYYMGLLGPRGFSSEIICSAGTPCLHCNNRVMQTYCIHWHQTTGISALCLGQKWQVSYTF